MGSSDTGTNMAVVDPSVGAVVWVRRRNGSWWPGKILDPEDLPASHLMSPRSGTPVKLLGRENASVDWYNLEKSKRVKAFRCGEFDDCLDRAEASRGMPLKKREKYARREDAIIHALELENLFMEKQYGKLGSLSSYKSNKSSDGVERELATSAESLRSGNDKRVDLKYLQLSGEPNLPLEGIISPLLQEVKAGNQLSGDDENSDVLPRMKSLQDLGLKITSLKDKIYHSDHLDGPLNDTSHALLNGCSTEDTIHANGNASSEKRKSSNEGLVEEPISKRRNRCRPLVQVLESSAKLPTPPSLKPEDSIVSLYARGVEQTRVRGCATRRKHGDQEKSCDPTDDTEVHPKLVEVSPSRLEDNSNLPNALSKDNNSRSTEDTETDSLKTDSNGTMAEVSDGLIEFRPKSMVKSEDVEEQGSMSSEEPDVTTTISDISHLIHSDDVSASVGVSKWQLKGKRNTRAVTKRYVDISGGKVSRELNQDMKLKLKGSYGSDVKGIFDKNYGAGMGEYGSGGLDGVSHDMGSRDGLTWNRGDSIEYIDPVSVCRGDKRKCMLTQVDIKVQSNSQREHVPMISLMSKFNGQAIKGHPVQIEAIDNCSLEALLAAADDKFNEDHDTAPPPVWSTARRTVKCRVPHPCSPPTKDEDKGEHLQHVHQDRKAPLNNLNGRILKHKMSFVKKNSSHSSHRKYLKKPIKKTSAACNQKTRTLSSIATQQKHNNHLKHGFDSNHVNGLIKTESAPPAVACIPIKLVFSRLYETLVT